MEKVVEINNLYKAYGETVAVNDISFSINAGEIFAIVGPKGAGKTTTIETMIGLRKPDRGTSFVALAGGQTANGRCRLFRRWRLDNRIGRLARGQEQECNKQTK
jgi:ABC-type multidrug transport system ATPase subunit